jgi:hypothetical protein
MSEQFPPPDVPFSLFDEDDAPIFGDAPIFEKDEHNSDIETVLELVSGKTKLRKLPSPAPIAEKIKITTYIDTKLADKFNKQVQLARKAKANKKKAKL